MTVLPLLVSLAFAAEPVEDVRATEGSELTADQLALLRDYRARHFSVRTEFNTTGVSTRAWSPMPYSGGGAIPHQDATGTTRSWAVYEGSERVNVPYYLELSGQDQERRDLVARVTMKRWLGRAYYGAAVAGVGTVIFSAIAVNSTEDDAKKNSFEKIGATGLMVAVVGLIGGSVPTAHAARLENDYTMSYIDIASAEDLVDVQNEALRLELGLTPSQAFEVESSTPAMAPPLHR